MIREVTMYKAVCDRCGIESNGAWITAELAISEVTNLDDWREIGGKLYCPDCYEYNEETDEYKLKKKED